MRPSATAAGWWAQASPSASVYTSPTLAPPDPGSTVGSPASWRSRSPAGSYQGELVPAPAAPPLRSRASPSGRPPLPPASRGHSQQQTASPNTSPATSQWQQRSPHQRRSVRELVRAWSGGSSLGTRECSPPAATAAAAAAAAAVAVADLEAQQLPPAHEARAFTWSQLGLSPAGSPATSRRVSENAAAPYRPPLPPSQQGEVHTNPVYDWPAVRAAGLEDCALGAAAGSPSHQVRRTASRSRLSRGVSFAEPAGEGSAHGGREGGGHSCRNSFLPLSDTLEQGSRREAGSHMNSRPSEQLLLQMPGELEGIQE